MDVGFCLFTSLIFLFGVLVGHAFTVMPAGYDEDDV